MGAIMQTIGLTLVTCIVVVSCMAFVLSFTNAAIGYHCGEADSVVIQELEHAVTAFVVLCFSVWGLIWLL